MRILRFAFLSCLLSSAAGAATYRAHAQLTMAPADQQRCLRIAGREKDCTVVDQARAAFAARVATMFTPTADAGLELVVTVTDADIVEEATGWLHSFELRTATRVLASNGTPIDEIVSQGHATMTPETLISTAAQTAATAAAAEFEDRLFRSPKMRDYLVATQIMRPSELARPRGDKLLWLALGTTLVQGGGDGDAGIGINARVAMSFRWFMLQAVYSWLHSSFQGTNQGSAFDSALTTHDFGLETGFGIRGSGVELRAGPGLHYLLASADGTAAPVASNTSGSISTSVGRFTPTLFASLSNSFAPRSNGSRIVVSLEFRGYLATRLDLPEFNRRVPVANTMFGIFAGGEFPWGGGSR